MGDIWDTISTAIGIDFNLIYRIKIPNKNVYYQMFKCSLCLFSTCPFCTKSLFTDLPIYLLQKLG
ncbi:hypothetical protein A8B75_18925 [Sphingomonadales bacterium EhC05]|nr:hypothetical protein A8B75_18925 [Sphingomonadales bacterium EhC05]